MWQQKEYWRTATPPCGGPCTHVNARGVKGALGDAGIVSCIWEAAVSQEAPPTVDDGSDDGHVESDGRGGAHESRGQADGEKRPHLRKGDGEAFDAEGQLIIPKSVITFVSFCDCG